MFLKSDYSSYMLCIFCLSLFSLYQRTKRHTFNLDSGETKSDTDCLKEVHKIHKLGSHKNNFK